MFRQSFATLLYGLIVFAACPERSAVAASPQLRDRMGELAKKILELTENRSVSIGVFSPTRLQDTNSASGLEETLKEELNRAGPNSVKPDAPFEVKADYAFIPSPDTARSNLKVVRIKVGIIEVAVDRELAGAQLDVELDSTATIAEVLQPTAKLDPDESKKEQNAQLEKAVGNKSRTAHIHGPLQSLVSTTANSPYSVDIVAAPLGAAKQPRLATLIDGQPLVAPAAGDLYELRVRNNSPDDVAITVSIDGIDI